MPWPIFKQSPIISARWLLRSVRYQILSALRAASTRRKRVAAARGDRPRSHPTGFETPPAPPAARSRPGCVDSVPFSAKWGQLRVLGDSARGADVRAAVSPLRDPTFPRPRPGPAQGRPGSLRGSGSKVRHGHRPRSSGGQGEAGERPARAGPGVPGRLGGGDPVVEGAQVACPSERCWGRPRRPAARPGPALRLSPPWLPPARWPRRFPLGETARILPGAPRPAPLLRPLPLAGEPVLARVREEALAACAGRGREGARSRGPPPRPAM